MLRSGRSLVGVLGLALVVTGLPAAMGAPYLQFAGDAARTGNTGDPGPAAYEIALNITLPGAATWNGPILLDGVAYVLVMDSGRAPHLNTTGIFRVPLDTGEPELIAELPDPVAVAGFPLVVRAGVIGADIYELASDGQRLFVDGPTGVHAFALDGTPLWRWDHPRLALERSAVYCTPFTAVTETAVYAACTEGGETPGDLGDENEVITSTFNYVVALDPVTGDELWLWVRDAADDLAGAAAPAGACETLGPSPLCRPSKLMHVWGLTKVGSTVVVATYELPVTPTANMTWRGLDAASGEPLWTLHSNSARQLVERDPDFTGHITGSGRRGYAWVQDLTSVNLDTGDVLWRSPIGGDDLETNFVGGTRMLAFDEASLYVTTHHTLYRTDPTSGATQALYRLERGDGQWFFGPTMVSNETVLGAHVLGVNINETEDPLAEGTASGIRIVHHRLVRIDIETGAVRWMYEWRPNEQANERILAYMAWSLGDGVVAMHNDEGTFTVIGHTPASIQVAASLPTAYPAPDETVELDLSETTPGAQGPATSFRVDWGDGSVSEWQASPMFNHAYAEVGEKVAEVAAANDAGQRSVRSVTFSVGGAPPPSAHPERSVRGVGVPDPGGTGRWDLAAAGILGFVVVSATAAVAVRRRRAGSGASTRSVPGSDRTGAYRAVVEAELRHGVPEEGLMERLAPVREAMGISDTEHARIAHEAGVALTETTGAGLGIHPGRLFLDRYRVQRRLGRGGAASTFLCRDERVDRTVVLKVLRGSDPENLESLMAEARAFAALNHPNVVTLLDVDRIGSEGFLVLEHLGGGTLAQELKRGRSERARLEHLAKCLLAAIGAIHERRMLHLDVKPSNVLLSEDGTYKLGDFGVAHLLGGDQTLMGLGRHAVGVGTPRYMSPEQARGGAVSKASDLYGAGLTLFEAWTGEAFLSVRPGETALDVQARAASPPAVRGRVDSTDPMASFFERALAVNPSERFGSASDMLEAFVNALT